MIECCQLCSRPWSGGHVCETEHLRSTLKFLKSNRKVTLADLVWSGWDDYYDDLEAHIEQMLAERDKEVSRE